MAMIDPTPRQKKIRPSSPSPTPTFALAKGTRGATQAMRKPAAKKDRRVARRVLAVSTKLAGRGHVRSSGLALSVAGEATTPELLRAPKLAPQLSQLLGLSMPSQSALGASV